MAGRAPPRQGRGRAPAWLGSWWGQLLVHEGLPMVAAAALVAWVSMHALAFFTHTDLGSVRRDFGAHHAQEHVRAFVDRRIPPKEEQLALRHDLKHSAFGVTMADGATVTTLRGRQVYDGAPHVRPPAFFFDHICFGVFYSDGRDGGRSVDLEAEFALLDEAPTASLPFETVVHRREDDAGFTEPGDAGRLACYHEDRLPPRPDYAAELATDAERKQRIAARQALEAREDALRNGVERIARRHHLLSIFEFRRHVWGKDQEKHSALLLEIRPVRTGLQHMRGSIEVFAAT